MKEFKRINLYMVPTRMRTLDLCDNLPNGGVTHIRIKFGVTHIKIKFYVCATALQALTSLL
jgi:hypothetical protein